jgi:hypothetical protein
MIDQPSYKLMQVHFAMPLSSSGQVSAGPAYKILIALKNRIS